MIDDLSTVRSAMALKGKKDYLFKPSDAYRMNGSQNKKAKGVGLNHPGGVNVHYYLKDYDLDKDSITLKFRNSAGEIVREFSNKAKEKRDSLAIKMGANKFNWNMQQAAAKKFKGMVFWWGSLAGPKVVPGDYTVELTINDEVQVQEFEILKDPRVSFTQAELTAQYDFITSINSKVTEAHESIIEMRKLKKQMIDFSKQHDNPVVKEKISELDSTLTAIEKVLYQTQNKSRQDPLNFPIRLTNKLAHLNSLSQMSDGPPTASMLAVKDDLTERIDVELEAYRKLKEGGVQELNDLIRSEIKDFIKLKETKMEP